MLKWIGRILAVLVIVIIGAVIYIEVNKKDLLALAIAEANKTLNGELTYTEADISIFSSFPDLRISLEGVNLVDAIQKEARPVMKADELSVDLNLISALQKNLIVNGLSVDGAKFYLANYKDGSNNYSLTQESEGGESEDVDFDISTYELNDVDLVYADHALGQVTSLIGLNADGKLSYKSNYIYLINDFTSRLELDYGAVLPAYGVNIGGVIENTINPNLDSIGINRSELLLNDLPVRLKGDIRMGDEVAYNFDFGSPATEIKRLISLLPNFYKNEYEDLISHGTYVLNGTVSGNTADEFPIYKLSVVTKDGALYYPDLDTRIDKLNFSLLAENTNKNSSYTKLLIDELDVKAGQSVLTGSMLSIPSGADHNVDLDLSGDINLRDVAKSVKLGDDTILEGELKGEIEGGAKLNPVGGNLNIGEKRFKADINIANLKYKDVATQFSLSSATIKGDKSQLDIKSNDVSYNDAMDFDLEAIIKDPLSIALDSNHVIKGMATITAGKIDLNKMVGEPTADSVISVFAIPNTNLDFKFSADEIIQGDYVMSDLTAEGNLSNKASEVDFGIKEFNGSKFNGTASLKNLLGYSLNGETLSGSVDLNSDKLDLNEFMHTGEGSSSQLESTEALIPSNIDLDINYESDQIVFKNIDIAKSLGNIGIADNKITFESAGNIFGGGVALKGTFDADRPEGYHISLSLDLTKLGFSETASQMKLFSQLLPIAKFLEGEFNAALSWSSDLDKNYMPDLNSLSAKGVIQTKNGKINGLLPIDSFLQKLNVVKKTVQPINIGDENRYFIVEDGKVMVQDVNFSKGDITVSMAGSHSFSQQMEYSLKVDVPKNIANVGNVVNLIQNKIKFSEKIKAAGENVSVEVDAFMRGNVLNPKFGINGLNLKNGDQIESIEDVLVETVEELKDSIITGVTDTINAVKEQVVDLADSIKNTVQDTIQATKDKVTDAVDSVKVVVSEEADKKKEELKKAGEGALDDLMKGNTDSLKVPIGDIFKENKGALDSLKMRIPKSLFPKFNRG